MAASAKRVRGGAPSLTALPLRDADDGDFLAVIETARGSANKLKYDEALGAFRLGHVLPPGLVFPFDFGFLPSTRGEDGDPLDVVVLMDEPAAAGVVVPCRVVGVIRATQAEPPSPERTRNDRFVAVAARSHRWAGCEELDDLPAALLDAFERFCVDYEARRGIDFRPEGRD
ncbi:MAG TPA: inorganic diphosphatase, partial [Burkholderiaceae bacterium]